MDNVNITHPTPETINPLLQRIRLPGETFTLPSGGAFYKNGELDDSVKNAEIHVQPMTAIDEIVMRTPDMLFSGEAIRQVFSRCIPQIKKVDDILAKDIDFLLVCLRKVSYGEEIRIEHKHTCENAKLNSYSVNINELLKKTKRLDPTVVTKQFSVTMPNGQIVLLRPIRYSDYLRIMQFNDFQDIKEPEQLKNVMLDSITNIIVKIDEIEDRAFIREWLEVVSPQYIKMINDHSSNNIAWGPEFKVKVVCGDCGKQMEVQTPMNPMSFFS